MNADPSTFTLSVVVPVYNEAANIRVFYDRVVEALDKWDVTWEVVFVNDGSKDETLASLLALHGQDPRVRIIDFSRNFGKECALSAGIEHASGDGVVSIDADLQHPPAVIPQMIDKWRAGADIVFGVRRTRKHESALKGWAAQAFYQTLGYLTDIPSPNNLGDFCLIDRKVVEVLRQLPEQNRFIKGLFAWVGFRQDFLAYDLQARHGGKTKWSYWRLWNFALEGITSFSTVPLRIWTYLGFVFAVVSMLYATFIIVRVSVYGIDVPGYASLIVAILFLGGVQLISLGVIGEYLGRVYIEVKGRPLYIVRNLYGFRDVEEKYGMGEPPTSQRGTHRAADRGD